MPRLKLIISVFIITGVVFAGVQLALNYYVYPKTLPNVFYASINSLTSSSQEKPPKAIMINLKSMVVDIFKEGEFVKRYSLVAAGDPRVCPTPKGEFQVLEKYRKVFSQSAYVWMPWSMRFYKQYYIHGIPYYSSGAKVKSVYSHGCLWLYEKDAQELYNWTPLNTKVRIVNAKLAKEKDEEMIYYLTDDGFKNQYLM